MDIKRRECILGKDCHVTHACCYLYFKIQKCMTLFHDDPWEFIVGWRIYDMLL